MNRSFIVAVLTVTMIVMMSATSHAAAAPHAFACESCHSRAGTGVKTSTTASAIAMNVACIGCHNSSGQASRKPIDADAMANYFGTDVNAPTVGSRSTHTFNASGISSKANTTEPVALQSTLHNAASINLVGQLLCIRCHSATSMTNNTYGVDKPFLRSTNADDALCLDCHVRRKVTDTTTGSHPVAYRSYSAVYKLNTTAFRKTPLSPNPNNPTAMLGRYFNSKGKIVCSTCHSVHYGDSNSATLDNRSTANGSAQDDLVKGLKGQLQNSKGQLLRTDPVGATAAAINVCSSCHKETKNLNHNGKGQNVQCNHCHGAHVDYVGATPPAGELSPNLYLVRRNFSNISTNGIKLGSNVKVIYNTATSLRFKRADGNGICQICHVPTPGVAIHDSADTRKNDCLACHTHSNGFSAADCNSCHGQPPITSLVGGPNGKASSAYTLDESFTAHRTHADKAYYNFACNNCHYNGTPAAHHNTKQSLGAASFQSVFVDTAGSIGANAGHPNTSVNYNPATRVCSNVYCHSNGAPRLANYSTVPTPAWTFGRGQIVGKASECSTCHGFGPTLNTNAHSAHVSTVGLKCYVCHNATVNASGGIADRTKHANGEKDVVFAARPDNFNGLFTAQLFNKTDASCTNSCHGAATPVWTNKSSGACGTCHAVPATSGAHTFHFTDATGPKLGTAQTVCANCHDFAAGNGKHANGQIDVKGCTPCHPTTAMVWTLPSSVTCESCHTGTTASVVGAFTAPLKNTNATTGHGQYGIANQCTNCHDASKNHIGAGPTEKRLLVAGNGLCDSCHTTAAGKISNPDRLDLYVHGGSVNKFGRFTSAVNLTNIATVRSDACAGCHDTHGTTNNHNIRTTINGLTVTYVGATPSYFDQTPDGNGLYHGLCQVCHTKTKYYNRNSAPAAHNASADCLSCHSHKPTKAPFFAFAPGGTCDTCHGYPPVKNLTGLAVAGNYTGAKFQDYSGGGGAHTVAGHISKTVSPVQGIVNCTNCHNDFNNSHNQGSTPVKKSFVNVVVDPKYKFNNATSIVYNSVNNSCSNVSCHFRPSPNWVTGN